jgi:hypothetical protein
LSLHERQAAPRYSLNRSPSSAFENFEPLYERPRVYSAPEGETRQRDSAEDEAHDFDRADEEFLRQLKEAARYLDDKLAARQREQQQLAILNQAPGLGRLLEPTSQRRQQQSAVYSYQEPTYGVLDERPGWQAALNGAEPDGSQPDEPETNVVLVDDNGDQQLISSSAKQVPDYKLLIDQLQERRQQQQPQPQQQQQQHDVTDAKYKQLLKSILSDVRLEAQANSLASASENQKRDSSDEPIKVIDANEGNKPEPVQEAPKERADGQDKAKYTTLLEDEQDSSGGNNNTIESAPITTTSSKDDGSARQTGASAEPTTTVTYGRLVYDQANGGRPAVVSNSSSPASGSSIFGRLYSNIAYYLPFLAQLTNLRQGQPNAVPDNGNATSGGSINNGTGVELTTSKEGASVAAPVDTGKVAGTNKDNEQDGQQRLTDNELHAKRNVSVPTALNKSGVDESGRTSQLAATGVSGNDGETKNQRQRENNDESQDNQHSRAQDDKQQQQKKHKVDSVRVSLDRKQANDDQEDGRDSGDEANDNGSDDNFTGQFGAVDEEQSPAATAVIDTKSGGLKRNQASARYAINANSNNNNDNSVELDMDMSQMVPAADTNWLGQQGPPVSASGQGERDQGSAFNRYNMLKHSGLMVPLGPSSDVLVRTTAGGNNRDSDSLLGKYIYAPTQHYYLNSMMTPAGGAGAGHRHHIVAANGKHIQPGDDIYGSYSDMPMKAAYAFQKEHNLIADKSNDLYFLIMVGAFCVMAMAVVLAAGLFAYRIQQSRKSSQDTDYPTYGVVGPNNMSAKCGAASFVGGYFTGPPSGSSKSGSAKHLPELYGTPNGVGGSDSGLNSLDKSSSNKKASSISSLNEHHQSSSSRAASNNFMAAASQDAARMYHYQHQKQQMIISDRNSGGRQTSASDMDSEDENDDGSYTVYECPGLASAHEMEIKNPLFNDDQSP